jgi:PRTRC genetic system protein B
MTNSNGNNPQQNNLQDDRGAVSPSNCGVVAIPDLFWPQIQWAESDYARLQGRLDLYSDFIILSKFLNGEVSQQYLVDPAEVAAALAGLNLTSNLLPENCLFWGKKNGADRLGIYLPPQVWLVTVRDEPLAWRVPLPGLIFTGHDYQYNLWAVSERPSDRQAPLYMAPCPNVQPEGVCRGNAPFPRAGATTIYQAVEAFFSSKFNRDLSNQKSQAYPDCVLDQWRTLHQAGAESYPAADLVKTTFTLGRLIDDELTR